MRKRPTKDEVEKLKVPYRILAGFILFVALLAGAPSLYFIFIAPIEALSFFFVFNLLFMIHVCGTIAFSGYAPNYLLFAHGPKKHI